MDGFDVDRLERLERLLNLARPKVAEFASENVHLALVSASHPMILQLLDAPASRNYAIYELHERLWANVAWDSASAQFHGHKMPDLKSQRPLRWRKKIWFFHYISAAGLDFSDLRSDEAFKEFANGFCQNLIPLSLTPTCDEQWEFMTKANSWAWHPWPGNWHRFVIEEMLRRVNVHEIPLAEVNTDRLRAGPFKVAFVTLPLWEAIVRTFQSMLEGLIVKPNLATKTKSETPKTKSIKLPTKRQWQTWSVYSSGITNQGEIANQLIREGVSSSQGMVSRDLKAIQKFLNAGGTALSPEEIGALPARVQFCDPAILDQGPPSTERYRAGRQRNRAN